MITPELKDRVLNTFVDSDIISGSFSIHSMGKENQVHYHVTDAILRHFEELNLMEFNRMLGGEITFTCKVAAYDFARHGDFVAQEDLLKKNIEKLVLELESLKTSAPERIASITSIISSITSALALFK